MYDWALVEATDPALRDLAPTDAGPMTGLLACCSITDSEYAFSHIHAPWPAPLPALVRVAGARWKIEESSAGGKELAALDAHQVRGWTSWHHWTVLAMLAHAFLSVLTAQQTTPDLATAGPEPDDERLVPLTRNEIRRLFTGLLAHAHPAEFHLHWSRWRRRHQAIAHACHYKRRLKLLT